MALNLTVEEQTTVNRSANQNITYYNASLGKPVQITDEFRAFLTLAPAGAKAAATAWFQALLAPMKGDVNRQLLFSTALIAEQADLLDQMTQLELFLLGYDEFRASFPGDNRFAEVPEIGMILDDTALVLGRIIQMRKSVKHRQRMNQVTLARYGNPAGNAGTTDAQIRQAMSWIAPLSLPLTVG